jgi:hypothetical protein
MLSCKAAAWLLAGLLTAAVPAAHALKIPSQESTGLAKGNSSEASMSGYGMEGPKKGGLKPQQKKDILAKLKAGGK